MSVFNLNVNQKIPFSCLKKKAHKAHLNIPLSHHRKKYKVKSSSCVNTEKAEKVNQKYSKMLQGTGKKVKSIHRY